MFRNISWSNYGMFILITLVVYYITIGCLYYLNEIKQLFSGKSSLLSKVNGSRKLAANNTSHEVYNSDTEKLRRDSDIPVNSAIHTETELPLSVHEYVNEVNDLLEYAADNNTVRQEILYSLQQLSKRYPSLENSPFKEYLTNYILNECANYCSIHLGEDELNTIWIS